ncbi:MAG: ANTAR domain-containing protein [Alistipes sp.]|nr:ANTAR domain-containing protein [Alistipes sp.]
MKKAIIVCRLREQLTDETEQTLKNCGYSCSFLSPDSDEMRRILSGSLSVELLLVVSPLADEQSMELAENAAAVCGVVFLCSAGVLPQVTEWLAEYGVESISLPINHSELTDCVLRLEENAGDTRESSDILTKTDDIRLINKAKSVLMQYLKFTEPQAHRHIEKTAMNSRCTRREAAERILKKYS